MPQLATLPTEILTEIFINLDYITLNAKLRLVCERFNFIIQEAANPVLLQKLFRGKCIPLEEFDHHELQDRDASWGPVSKEMTLKSWIETADDQVLLVHPAFMRLAIDFSSLAEIRYDYSEPERLSYGMAWFRAEGKGEEYERERSPEGAGTQKRASFISWLLWHTVPEESATFPPTSRLLFQFHTTGGSGLWGSPLPRKILVGEGERGVTVKDVLEAVLEEAYDHPDWTGCNHHTRHDNCTILTNGVERLSKHFILSVPGKE